MFMRVDTLVSDSPPADEFEARLGRRLCVGLVWSESTTPGPIDFRGAFEARLAAPLPEMGGYWLVRRVRIARGAAGGSIAPGVPDVVEETLLWRVDTLVRLRIDPDRIGRVPEVIRLVEGPRVSFDDVSIASIGRFSPVIWRSPPPGAGNLF